jgi:hypothetical protein
MGGARKRSKTKSHVPGLPFFSQLHQARLILAGRFRISMLNVQGASKATLLIGRAGSQRFLET